MHHIFHYDHRFFLGLIPQTVRASIGLTNERDIHLMYLYMVKEYIKAEVGVVHIWQTV